MKTFFKKIILYILPVFPIMIILNCIIDPANLFSGIKTRIAEYLSEGYNVKNVPNIDERLLQNRL